jgi:hypothetical protein
LPTSDKSSAAAVVVMPIVTISSTSPPNMIRQLLIEHPAADTVIGAATVTPALAVEHRWRMKLSKATFATSNRNDDVAVVQVKVGLKFPEPRPMNLVPATRFEI